MQAGSSRVKASVGGFLPIIKKREKNGNIVEEVVSMLWNDLALTISPVNPTVEPAYILQRSFNGLIVKALSAGYGTDSATFTGGRAMIPEDLEGTKRVKFLDDDILLFLSEVMKGHIKTKADVQSFLSNTAKTLSEIVKIIEDNREILVSEGGLSMELDKLFPFLTKSTGEKTGAVHENKVPKNDAEEEQLEGSDHEGEDDKEEDDEVLDATPVLKSLSDSISMLEKKIDALTKSFSTLTTGQEMIGKALATNIEQVSKIAGSPNPRASAINSLDILGKGTSVTSGVKKRHKPFTKTSRAIFSTILQKAVQNGELDILACSEIERQINKSIEDANFQLDQKYIAFLENKMKEER